MEFPSRPFDGQNGDDGQESMPWDRRPSILEFVRAHIPTDAPGVDEEGCFLPDDERANAGLGFRWGMGSMDGVMTHHAGVAENEETVRKTVELVLAYSRQPTVANKAAVYQHILTEHVVSIIDPVIQTLLREQEIAHDRVYELARSFVTEAPDREPVKFGIALLGLYRQPADQELFQALGRHDEFTLYCAVAVTNSSDDRDEALWMLARNVTGWGRIHVVERLARTTTRPEIKDWLLREGFRNSILYEYLAATCARAGGLLVALSEDCVDRDLLTAAGEIIQALIRGGPAESIDHYEDARPVLESYLDHMAASAEFIKDFLSVNSIKHYLDEDDSNWAARFGTSWTPESRQALRSACISILGRPEWEGRVRAQLRSESDLEFAHADQAARALGIDTWDLHWQRLQTKPSNAGLWYHVMEGCDESRIGPVLEFAEASIDLAVIATGAGAELGLGHEFEQHSCLDFVLQALPRFPGQGARFIDAGLKSPVIRNRNMAVVALAAWPREASSSGMMEALQRAAECEPDLQVLERMRQVLRGEPLSS